MQFTANETQAMLRDSVRRFVEKDYTHADADAFGRSAGHWAIFAEQGWIAAGVPEAAGGLGGDAFDTCLIAEELGRGLVREAYVPYAAVTARLLSELAPDHALLAGLLWGERRPLLVHHEQAAREDAGFVECLAVPSGDGFVLRGEKYALQGAPAATTLLVSSRIAGEEGLTLFAIEPEQAGVTRQDFRTIDNRGASHLRLAEVQVPREAILGPRGGAASAIAAAIDHGLVAAAAEALGAMHTALLMTRDYLRIRKQFGVPIGDFQALRHRLADMFIETEMARSLVLRAIAGLGGSDAAERRCLASTAKSRVGKAGLFVGGQAIQLHGGIGITEEYAVGHHYKRLMAFDLAMGTGGEHLDSLVRAESRGAG